MLHSMTGFGRTVQTLANKEITVEIRSLNSKQTDVRLKIPQAYRTKELQLRKLFAEKLFRGKIEVTITTNSLNGEGGEHKINQPLFIAYYKQVKAIADELGLDPSDTFSNIVRLPNVVTPDDSVISDEEWAGLKLIIQKSIDKINSFKTTEGNAMEADLNLRVNNIYETLLAVEPLEEQRKIRVKERIRQHLLEHMDKHNIDENRFEQEILFYLEKMDITEEKVRLGQHCKYFKEILENKEIEKGRKLVFITQEMGREINTLGAKANNSDMQRLVVRMKDELEKIKEQCANIV